MRARGTASAATAPAPPTTPAPPTAPARPKAPTPLRRLRRLRPRYPLRGHAGGGGGVEAREERAERLALLRRPVVCQLGHQLTPRGAHFLQPRLPARGQLEHHGAAVLGVRGALDETGVDERSHLPGDRRGVDAHAG